MSDFSQDLRIKQSQQLVMTPQLQQAIKLLQLSNQELSELVEKEMEHNPLLEKEEPEEQDQEFDNSDEPDKPLEDFDAGSAMADVGAGGSTSFDRLDQSFENSLSNTTTLRDHLMDQTYLSFDDNKDVAIAAQLIDRLDESGYLREDTDALIDTIGCQEERFLCVLETCRHFEPTGVFAKDLPDCLGLQLAEKNRLDPAMQIFLENLDKLAVADFKGLSELCGVDEDDVKDMAEEIRRLNPKPAGDFDHIVVQTAIPDVLMKKRAKNLGGGWKVELNAATLPKVLVNQEYYTTVSKSASRKEDKKYLENQLASANWLVRAMDQRAKTILKVASDIIEKQYNFFLFGVEYLQPLTLREVSEAVEVHESTVSRVTTNKYIGTPRGIFELKYFFSSGVSGGAAGDVASEAVKAKIKALIEKEQTPKDVLSDDKIADILSAESNIDIARRTVAKYREAIGFGSSVQRRKILKNKA